MTKHGYTSVYSPDSNEAAERVNRTLFEDTSTLFQSANSHELWVEAS